MRILKLILVPVLLFFLVGTSHAVDYYWTNPFGGSPSSFPDPESACKVKDGAQWTSAGSKWVYLPKAKVNSAQYYCYYKTLNADGSTALNNYPAGYTARNGNGCSVPGATYDETLGMCVNPPTCADKTGQTHSFYSSTFSIGMCVDGCEFAAIDVNPFKRTVSSIVIYHTFGAYTGEDCIDGTPVVDPEDSTTPATEPPMTESTADEQCTDTTTDAEGRQVSSCMETKTNKDNAACAMAGGKVGTVNGSITCVAANKGPTAQEKTKETKVTTSTNATTGNTETKTEVTDTNKTCAGTAECKVTSNTTTTTEVKGSDGTTVSSSSSCKGDNCPSLNSDGTSDSGSGSEEGEEEQEEEGIPGPSKALAQGEQGDFQQGIDEWDQRIQEVKGNVDDKLDQISSSFSGVFDLGLSTGGGSLPCDHIPVNFGTSGSQESLSFCMADYEEPLSYIRYAVLLAASVVAALIILRAN